MTAAILKNKLRAKASPQAAKMCQSFFKTGPGDYGEGAIDEMNIFSTVVSRFS